MDSLHSYSRFGAAHIGATRGQRTAVFQQAPETWVTNGLADANRHSTFLTHGQHTTIIIHRLIRQAPHLRPAIWDNSRMSQNPVLSICLADGAKCYFDSLCAPCQSSSRAETWASRTGRSRMWSQTFGLLLQPRSAAMRLIGHRSSPATFASTTTTASSSWQNRRSWS